MSAVSRRRFIGLLPVSLATWPIGAYAQDTKTYRVGFLSSSTAAKYAGLIDAFRAELRARGYEEGKNIVLEFGFANDDNARLPALAAGLVARGIEVVVTQGTPATRAAKNSTRTVPIVIAVAGDAVTAGLVSNLAHPEGNVTGNTFFAPELGAKRLDLLKQAAPQVKRLAVLVNPANPVSQLVMQTMRHTADALQLELTQYAVTETGQLEQTFSEISSAKSDGVVVFEDGVTIGNAPFIARLAVQHKLAMAGFASMAKSGALVGYGADIPALFRRAAYFVDMILKGNKPANLPVERAEKFQFILNLKTAKALGLTLPQALLAGADQIIE